MCVVSAGIVCEVAGIALQGEEAQQRLQAEPGCGNMMLNDLLGLWGCSLALAGTYAMQTLCSVLTIPCLFCFNCNCSSR